MEYFRTGLATTSRCMGSSRTVLAPLSHCMDYLQIVMASLSPHVHYLRLFGNHGDHMSICKLDQRKDVKYDVLQFLNEKLTGMESLNKIRKKYN